MGALFVKALWGFSGPSCKARACFALLICIYLQNMLILFYLGDILHRKIKAGSFKVLKVLLFQIYLVNLYATNSLVNNQTFQLQVGIEQKAQVCFLSYTIVYKFCPSSES